MSGPAVLRFRPFLVAAAALAAAVALYVAFLLPSAPLRVALSGPEDPTVLKGALHLHTIRSDGGGTIDDVASAAAAAGLHFIVVTDHGDGRRAEPPSYRHGVLVIDGAEISTDDGHLVAAGFRIPPYRLAGEGRDVIEDVHRLGGIAVLAHPTSPRAALAWQDWDAPFDGMEVLNGDSAWRDESVASLVRLVAGYPFRPSAAVAAAFDRPVRALERYDALAATRSIAALAGHDAHARIAPGGDPVEEGTAGGFGTGWRRGLPLPGYRTAFESFAVRVLANAVLSGDPDDDASMVVGALRRGRAYMAVDGIASPARVSFTAQSGAATAGIGDWLIPEGPLRFEVTADGPPRSRIRLLLDGKEVLAGPIPALRGELPVIAGGYRVEIEVPGAPGAPPMPWVMTNPIRVGLPARPLPEIRHVDRVLGRLSDPGNLDAWSVEREADSSGSITPGPGGGLVLDYRLGGSRASSPYVALARAVELEPGARAVEFRVRAGRPMRLSLQVRAPGGKGGLRWRRSFYADTSDRLVRVEFDEMRSAEPGQPESVPVDRVEALLLVVDTVNSDPNEEGRVWVWDVTVH